MSSGLEYYAKQSKFLPAKACSWVSRDQRLWENSDKHIPHPFSLGEQEWYAYNWLQESSLQRCSHSLHHYSLARLQPKPHWLLCAGPDHTITTRQEGEGGHASAQWNPWASAHSSGVWASSGSPALTFLLAFMPYPDSQRSFVNTERGRHRTPYRGLTSVRWYKSTWVRGFAQTDAQMVINETLSITPSLATCPTLKQTNEIFYEASKTADSFLMVYFIF